MEKIIYSKFSKERGGEFAIRTDIVQGDDGCFVRKTNVYPQGEAHISQINANYHLLQEQYAPVGLKINRCMRDKEGLRLEFLCGDTLQQLIEEHIQKGKLEEAEQLFDRYLEKCFFSLPTFGFQETEEFVRVFGRQEFDDKEPAVSVANIDLICSNILVNDQGWHVIDYEWTFPFPVPLGYMMYRAAFLAHHQMKRCDFLALDALMEKLHITEESQAKYRQMEQHFQEYIRKGVPSNYEIQQRIGRGVITISDISAMIERENALQPEGKRKISMQTIVEKTKNKIKRLGRKILQRGGIFCCIDETRFTSDEVVISGWALEERDGAYQDVRILVKQEAEASEKPVVTRCRRPDVEMAVCHGMGEKRQFGFHIVMRLPKSNTCILQVEGEKSKKTISLDLRKEREHWRRYKTPEDMKRLGDSWQEEDDAFYLKNRGKHFYNKIIQRRLSGENVPYMCWHKQESLDEAARQLQRGTHFAWEPKISILVPAYRTPRDFLIQMLESVREQTYENWELCIADASLNDSIRDILEEYHQKDERIKYVLLDSNAGISGNTNEAMKLAEGEFIALLDHDDLLTEDALFEVVRCINEQGAEVLYTDEDKVSMELDYYFDPNLKPDFNRELLYSCNYICHFFVVKKQIADRVGWFRSSCDGSQDYDFILRCTGAVEKVGHVARVVYHWRCHPESTAMNPESKLYCYEAGERALRDYLEEKKIPGRAQRMPFYGCYQVSYPLLGKPKVLALILNGTEFNAEYPRLQKMFLQNVTPGNVYSRMAEALKNAEADYVYIGQGSGSIITEGGLERLVSNLQRDTVDMAGCKVVSSDDRIIDIGRTPALQPKHQGIYRGEAAASGGYQMRTLVQQEVSAFGLNGIMLETALLQEALKELEKKNEQRPQTLSVYLRRRGKRIIFVPVLCRLEQSFAQAEACQIDFAEPVQRDCFYNPQFRSMGKAFELGW